MPRLCIILAMVVALGSCMPPARESSRISRSNSTINVPSADSHPSAPLLVRKANGHYRVSQPWTVQIGGKRWHVQQGYTSNGITAPSKVKSALGDNVDAPETWAAVFHDWLFTQPGISRSEADHLFYELLIAYKVPSQKARMMFTFVAAYSTSKELR